MEIHIEVREGGIRVRVNYEWIIAQIETRLDNHYLVNFNEVARVLRELDAEQGKDRSSSQCQPE